MNIQQYFYIKNFFYACYVKNIVLPISFLTNIGNKKGKCYVGNKQKLRNSTVRTKTNLIQKALHNFYNSKMLSFVTLTYKDNMQDVKKAIDDVKSLNQTDVGVKAYAFSHNCKNHIVVRGIKKLTIGDIIKASFNATNVF